MANSHWSQASYNAKFFFMSAVPLILTIPLIVLAQFTSLAYWVLGGIWIYVIVFEMILKMPLQYTLPLLRTKIFGKNKLPRNDKDNFEL
ncbi:hypothetical protein [Psychrobacter sp. AOP31-A1-22]|uniref:hypothetical protein n=1 Tax=Psychrobacter sp. AOP31-A1-22 TaxID=3457696 RepID=UPI0040368D11